MWPYLWVAICHVCIHSELRIYSCLRKHPLCGSGTLRNSDLELQGKIKQANPQKDLPIDSQRKKREVIFWTKKMRKDIFRKSRKKWVPHLVWHEGDGRIKLSSNVVKNENLSSSLPFLEFSWSLFCSLSLDTSISKATETLSLLTYLRFVYISVILFYLFKHQKVLQIIIFPFLYIYAI